MNGTAAMTQDMAAVMEEIRHLAATRKHSLAKNMLGTRSLAPVQAERILNHLRHCPPLEGREAPVPGPQAVTGVPRETSGSVPPGLTVFKGRIPAGYYATPSRTGSNDVDFWKVDVPSKGKWEGYSFVRRVLGGAAQAGEEMRTEDLQNMQQRLALQAITELGLDESQMLFAEKLGRCGDCGRFLTDEVSRAHGKGPVCRNKKR